MSIIHLGRGARLKSYGANVKGLKALLRIEVEISDSYTLAGKLEDLGAIDREQKADEKAARKTVRKAAAPLLLGYHQGGES